MATEEESQADLSISYPPTGTSPLTPFLTAILLEVSSYPPQEARDQRHWDGMPREEGVGQCRQVPCR